MTAFAWSALAWGLCGLALLGVLGHLFAYRGQTLIVVATGAHYLMALSVPALIISIIATTAAPAANAATIAVSLVLIAVTATLHYPLYGHRSSPLYGHRSSPLYGHRSSPAEGDRLLNVLTANLLLGRAHYAAVVELLSAEDIDIFLAQELTEPARDGLTAAGIDEQFPHSFTEPAGQGSGTGIWSRYPLIDCLSHPGFGFRVLSARVVLDGSRGPLVWSVHLQPPWPRRPAGWLAELPRLRELLAAVPRSSGLEDAVVVGGDFNATWNHHQFRQLRRDDYEDASVLGAGGALLSWPADKPGPALIGLDHILLRSAQVDSVRTVRVAGSDHLAVLGRIVLPA